MDLNLFRIWFLFGFFVAAAAQYDDDDNDKHSFKNIVYVIENGWPTEPVLKFCFFLIF